ncbi:hypothetical protein [Thermosipho atlanticus]|uniref:Uncharacterized protein n=1 Tax=Thermosipho atlanticus DSM 15807 TaxID=1123380 RepID=A0A1M5R0Y5_9BACT|nr:hypothetical protein [Thermosipho atlanticus]SHH19828.1 hypothetical protein SAMN02745199_0265 [Thermosipho atlanticus DSM 15807]
MIKKVFVFLILVISVFLFGVRYVENPAFSLNQNTALGFEYGTYFGGIHGWTTNFGLYYNEFEENMIGNFYLFASKDSSQSINEVGYSISGENDTIKWGGDIKIVNYTDESTSAFLMNIGIGFAGEIFDNVFLGAFLDDFSIYSQYPGEAFKGNVGIDLVYDLGNFVLYANMNYIKQEYFQFNIGGGVDFDFIALGGYWSPEYYNKVGAFYNKMKGYFAFKIGNLSAKIDAFYSFSNVSSATVDLPMNYENHSYGYNVTIEVRF